MDQNIEESLSLEGSMGVDFEHSGDIVIQGDIGLQESSQEIPMDFETTEGQTILMETENEEVIVSDFIDDPLTLSEYTLSEHSNDMATLNPTVSAEASTSLSSQSDTIVDLQYQQATLTAIKSESQPRIVTLKNLSTLTPTTKKADSGVLKTVPRQVAIAPKPNYPVLAAKMNQKVHKSMGHVPIAPKPMISNKPVTFVSKNPIGGTLKKVSIAGVVQAANKGNSVLAQIGKQLIMVPSGGQKIKLVSSNSLGGVQYVTGDKQKIMTKKSIDGQNKQILPKLITVQGQDDSQPVVITKLMSEGAGKLSQARFVTVQQKTAPSQLTQHLANKVLLKSPVKAVPAGTKKHEIIAIHAPTPIAPALTPVSGSSGVPENKVPIPANLKKVVVKPVSSQNFAQIAKKANVSEGSHTQLHQINVPGKGVQYIRLITNPGSAKPVAVKAQAAASAAPAKTFVLTDSKGNLIHMTADKMSSQPPPSLIITNNAPPKLAKIPQKLVRIAPIPPKTSQAATPRPAQSLLAPMSAEVPVAKQEVTVEHLEEAQMEEIEVQFESKESLQRMIEEATVDVENDATMSTEQESADDADDGDGMEGGDGAGDAGGAGDRSGELEGDLERDLIVIPAFDNSEYMLHDKYKQSEQRDLVTVNVQCEREELLPAYTPPPPQLPDELIMRPRKACNCTKSQCLKLYCDCFANGEFCNQCNCNNCHNNLENEELRQKAIRGCLDRNPHAFRPKIGKTKSGGPEIVRRHNKGCNCKRSGCLKNYCECYEAKIACTYMCKCVGCRNVEETLERGRHPARNRRSAPRLPLQPLAAALDKQPCTLMTDEVIDAVCQCLLAVATEGAAAAGGARPDADPVSDVIDEFARCLRDVISAAHHAPAPATPEGAA